MRVDRIDDGSIYHYTTASILLSFIIPFGRLRFSPFKSSIDPRERIPLALGLSIREDPEHTDDGVPLDDPDGSKFFAINDNANEIARQKVQMLCFTNSYEPLHPGFQMDRDGDRGWAQAAMWTHFGGRHSGVCLEFERSSFLSDLGRVTEGSIETLSGDVQYPNSSDFSKHLSNLEIDTIGDASRERIYGHLAQNSTAVFFTKDANWSYEDEFRVVALTECGEPVFAPIEGSLKRVILGDQVDPTMAEAIRWSLGKSGIGVPVERMFWHSTATFGPMRLDPVSENSDPSTPASSRPAPPPDTEHKHSPSCRPTMQLSNETYLHRESLWEGQFNQKLRSIITDTSSVASEHFQKFTSLSGWWIDDEHPDRYPARRAELHFEDLKSDARISIAITLQRIDDYQLLNLSIDAPGKEPRSKEWKLEAGSSDQARRSHLRSLATELALVLRDYIQAVRKPG